MSAKFEIMKNYYSGRFYWRFLAANGDVITQAESYTSKTGCIDAINLVKTVAPTAPIIDLVKE
jgi:uncharacterized protein YegP (UPF0339 family)